MSAALQQPRAPGPAPRRRPPARAELRTELLTTFAAVEAVEPAWARLHGRAPTGSAFDHPGWAIAWAREFVADGDLCCVAVRDPADERELVGFAPFYRRRLGGRRLGVACLQPLGTGPGEALTEVTQVVCDPALTGTVLTAVLDRFMGLEGWSWLQLVLAPAQGWLVPQWLPDPGAVTILHRAVRPSVVFRLRAADRAELLGSLKRNVRESVRRGVNRTRGLGTFALRTARRPDEVPTALQSVVELHAARAAMPDKVVHRDVTADAAHRRFLAHAAWNLAGRGLATVHVASIDGVDVAGLLVLSDGATDYLSLTGLDPACWDLNLSTLLVFEALAAATEQGRSAVNLSTGPDVAKLRWSTELAVHHDFAVVRHGPRAQAAYAAYAQLGLARRQWHERERHRRAG